MQLKVSKQEGGQTLLSFLRGQLKNAPSVKAIKRAIDAKQCKINGRVEYFSTHKVKEGDFIEITLEKKKPLASSVLFEDEDLILFNKAPGVTSEAEFLVHRLDKETSGVFLVAKNANIQKELIDLFRQRKVEKEYLAIVDGIVKTPKWRVDNFLGRRVSYQGGVLFGKVSKEKGKRSVTDFELVKTNGVESLVLAKPITGRTHQIRVHLKDLTHPVLGDWQYARSFQSSYPAPRVLLHAQTLRFVHPRSKKKLTVDAPHFRDFLEATKTLFPS